MAVSLLESAFVVTGGQSVSLADIVSVTPAASDPTYLVVNGLDRNEYTASESGATGALVGNGTSDSLKAIDSGDDRGAGIVFTYQASTGRYYNATYGYLDQLTYTASSSASDVANLSIFTTNSLSVATAYANDVYSLAESDASGYIGSATVVTAASKTAATVPSQATPDSIAAVADSFVGDAWNMNGCWVLASTIAAEAGAGLPVQSTMIGVAGKSSGEWIVAFDGPAGQTGNWESLVKTGEMVVILDADGSSGHITTVVSGSGSTAKVVDNIVYETASGKITNAANDGSTNDVIISAPHLASQEFAGVQTSSVVIYELDTPIVSDLVSVESIAFGASVTLSHLFSATDPAARTITEYQVYDTDTADGLTVGGVFESAHTAAAAVTVTSLTTIGLTAGSSAGTDTLDVRAYNGTYWGDWQTLSVTVASAVTPEPPTVLDPTATQTWQQGKAVSFTLPANTFSDPNGEALTLTATLANGAALPSWLTFNAATDTFSGTVPDGTNGFTITVKATDTSNLSVSETFAVTVPALSPMLEIQTANQTWTTGQMLNFSLPAGTFVDPQGETLTYTAWQESGRSVTSWLHFNASSETFTGTVPTSASGTVILAVEATDTSGLSTWDEFAVTFSHAGTTAKLVGSIALGSGALMLG